MRSRIHTVLVPSEIGDFAEEIRRAFLELGRSFAAESLVGECSPPIDVFETDETVEITVDLPGASSTAVRVMFKADTVLVVGEKPVRRGGVDSSFHLVERGFGRFARTVRIGRACDGSRAHARLVKGELRISIPKIAERRGRTFEIQVMANG